MATSTEQNQGMKNRGRSSILKPPKQRLPLQDLIHMQTRHETTRSSKRVCFAASQVREFRADTEVMTLWESSYVEEIYKSSSESSHESDSSNPDCQISTWNSSTKSSWGVPLSKSSTEAQSSFQCDEDELSRISKVDKDQEYREVSVINKRRNFSNDNFMKNAEEYVEDSIENSVHINKNTLASRPGKELQFGAISCNADNIFKQQYGALTKLNTSSNLEVDCIPSRDGNHHLQRTIISHPSKTEGKKFGFAAGPQDSFVVDVEIPMKRQKILKGAGDLIQQANEANTAQFGKKQDFCRLPSVMISELQNTHDSSFGRICIAPRQIPKASDQCTEQGLENWIKQDKSEDKFEKCALEIQQGHVHLKQHSKYGTGGHIDGSILRYNKHKNSLQVSVSNDETDSTEALLRMPENGSSQSLSNFSNPGYITVTKNTFSGRGHLDQCSSHHEEANVDLHSKKRLHEEGTPFTMMSQGDIFTHSKYGGNVKERCTLPTPVVQLQREVNLGLERYNGNSQTSPSFLQKRNNNITNKNKGFQYGKEMLGPLSLEWNAYTNKIKSTHTGEICNFSASGNHLRKTNQSNQSALEGNMELTSPFGGILNMNKSHQHDKCDIQEPSSLTEQLQINDETEICIKFPVSHKSEGTIECHSDFKGAKQASISDQSETTQDSTLHFGKVACIVKGGHTCLSGNGGKSLMLEEREGTHMELRKTTAVAQSLHAEYSGNKDIKNTTDEISMGIAFAERGDSKCCTQRYNENRSQKNVLQLTTNVTNMTPSCSKTTGETSAAHTSINAMLYQATKGNGDMHHMTVGGGILNRNGTKLIKKRAEFENNMELTVDGSDLLKDNQTEMFSQSTIQKGNMDFTSVGGRILNGNQTKLFGICAESDDSMELTVGASGLLKVNQTEVFSQSTTQKGNMDFTSVGGGILNGNQTKLFGKCAESDDSMELTVGASGLMKVNQTEVFSQSTTQKGNMDFTSVGGGILNGNQTKLFGKCAESDDSMELTVGASGLMKVNQTEVFSQSTTQKGNMDFTSVGGGILNGNQTKLFGKCAESDDSMELTVGASGLLKVNQTEVFSQSTTEKGNLDFTSVNGAILNGNQTKLFGKCVESDDSMELTVGASGLLKDDQTEVFSQSTTQKGNMDFTSVNGAIINENQTKLFGKCAESANMELTVGCNGLLKGNQTEVFSRSTTQKGNMDFTSVGGGILNVNQMKLFGKCAESDTSMELTVGASGLLKVNQTEVFSQSTTQKGNMDFTSVGGGIINENQTKLFGKCAESDNSMELTISSSGLLKGNQTEVFSQSTTQKGNMDFTSVNGAIINENQTKLCGKCAESANKELTAGCNGLLKGNQTEVFSRSTTQKGNMDFTSVGGGILNGNQMKLFGKCAESDTSMELTVGASGLLKGNQTDVFSQSTTQKGNMDFTSLTGAIINENQTKLFGKCAESANKELTVGCNGLLKGNQTEVFSQSTTQKGNMDFTSVGGGIINENQTKLFGKCAESDNSMELTISSSGLLKGNQTEVFSQSTTQKGNMDFTSLTGAIINENQTKLFGKCAESANKELTVGCNGLLKGNQTEVFSQSTTQKGNMDFTSVGGAIINENQTKLFGKCAESDNSMELTISSSGLLKGNQTEIFSQSTTQKGNMDFTSVNGAIINENQTKLFGKCAESADMELTVGCNGLLKGNQTEVFSQSTTQKGNMDFTSVNGAIINENQTKLFGKCAESANMELTVGCNGLLKGNQTEVFSQSTTEKGNLDFTSVNGAIMNGSQKKLFDKCLESGSGDESPVNVSSSVVNQGESFSCAIVGKENVNCTLQNKEIPYNHVAYEGAVLSDDDKGLIKNVESVQNKKSYISKSSAIKGNVYLDLGEEESGRKLFSKSSQFEDGEVTGSAGVCFQKNLTKLISQPISGFANMHFTSDSGISDGNKKKISDDNSECKTSPESTSTAMLSNANQNISSLGCVLSSDSKSFPMEFEEGDIRLTMAGNSVLETDLCHSDGQITGLRQQTSSEANGTILLENASEICVEDKHNLLSRSSLSKHGVNELHNSTCLGKEDLPLSEMVHEMNVDFEPSSEAVKPSYCSSGQEKEPHHSTFSTKNKYGGESDVHMHTHSESSSISEEGPTPAKQTCSKLVGNNLPKGNVHEAGEQGFSNHVHDPSEKQATHCSPCEQTSEYGVPLSDSDCATNQHEDNLILYSGNEDNGEISGILPLDIENEFDICGNDESCKQIIEDFKSGSFNVQSKSNREEFAKDCVPTSTVSATSLICGNCHSSLNAEEDNCPTIVEDDLTPTKNKCTSLKSERNTYFPLTVKEDRDFPSRTKEVLLNDVGGFSSSGRSRQCETNALDLLVLLRKPDVDKPCVTVQQVALSVSETSPVQGHVQRTDEQAKCLPKEAHFEQQKESVYVNSNLSVASAETNTCEGNKHSLFRGKSDSIHFRKNNQNEEQLHQELSSERICAKEVIPKAMPSQSLKHDVVCEQGPTHNAENASLKKHLKRLEQKDQCLWTVEELTDQRWCFQFLFRTLQLVVEFDAALPTKVSNVCLVSHINEKIALMELLHNIMHNRLTASHLKEVCQYREDVQKVLDEVSESVKFVMVFRQQFQILDVTDSAVTDGKRVTFQILSFILHLWFRVTVDLSNWSGHSLSPSNISAESEVGDVNVDDLRMFLKTVVMGPKFLRQYVEHIHRYIEAREHVEG